MFSAQHKTSQRSAARNRDFTTCGTEDVPTQRLEAGALSRLEPHSGVEAAPREARASRRKRELLPAEHLYAPRTLARPLAEGRLPEEDVAGCDQLHPDGAEERWDEAACAPGGAQRARIRDLLNGVTGHA